MSSLNLSREHTNVNDNFGLDKTPRPRHPRPRKLYCDPNQEARPSQEESTGGVPLTSRTAPVAQAYEPASAAEQRVLKSVSTVTTRSSRRRKPKKLNQTMEIPGSSKSECSGQVPGKENANDDMATPLPGIDAIKSRVSKLEQEMKELQAWASEQPSSASTNMTPAKILRRRTNISKPPTPTVEELQSVKGELAATKRELRDLHTVLSRPNLPLTRSGSFNDPPRSVSMPSTSGISTGVPRPTNEDIEKVSRLDSFPIDRGSQQRMLSGSYKIPIPQGVSMDDLRAVQTGFASATSLVRNLRLASSGLSASRTSQQRAQQPFSSGRLKRSKSWGEWLGGYSRAIMRLMGTIETEAAIESQSRLIAPGTPVAKANAIIPTEQRP